MSFKIVKNVAFNWVGMIAAIVYGFVLTPYVVHRLGNSHYGLWNLIMSCVGYMVILDFGMQSAMNRYFSRYRGLEDPDGLSTVYSTAVVVYSTIGIIAFVVGLAVTMNVERLFNVEPLDVGLARSVLLIMTVYTSMEFLFNIFGSLLYACQRFDVLNAIQLAFLCLQGCLVWLVLGRGAGLFLYAVVIIGSGLAKYTIQYLFVHRIVSRLRFDRRLISKGLLKQMISYSGVTFLAVMTNSIIFKTDNIVIGMFLTAEAITIFSIGFMLSDYTATIVTKMCATLTPLFSELEARGKSGEINSLIMTSSRFSSLVGIPIALGVIVIGKDFITLWMGDGYRETYGVMVVLMACRMVGFPAAPLYSMLYGLGKHYISLYTGLFEAAVNLILSLALVRHYGIMGVAVGTFVPNLLANIVFPVVVCRKTGIELSQWLKEAVYKPSIFCFIFYLAIKYVCDHVRDVSWANLAGRFFVIAAVYVLLMWVFGLRSKERLSIRNALHGGGN